MSKRDNQVRCFTCGGGPETIPLATLPAWEHKVATWKLPFGQFRGWTLARVYEEHPHYLAWALRTWNRNSPPAFAVFRFSKLIERLRVSAEH